MTLAVIAEMDSPGISAGQLMIMEDLFKHAPTTVGEMAKRTQLSQTLVSRTMQQACEAKVVELKQSQIDKRQTVISLNPNATDFIQSRKHTSIHTALEKAMPNATMEDRKRAEALLQELALLLGTVAKPMLDSSSAATS